MHRANHSIFFVVLEKDINAFAGPGGYIGVNSGLILTTEAESELASVMAHEIAHVTQRHLYRAFGMPSSRLVSPKSTAARDPGRYPIGHAVTSRRTGGLGCHFKQAAFSFKLIFTRENEEEADRVGMQTLVGPSLTLAACQPSLRSCSSPAAITDRISLNF